MKSREDPTCISDRCRRKGADRKARGVCYPVPTSKLAAAMGVENWRCDKCGAVYAFKVAERSK